MGLKADLRPTGRNRVIDLVRAAGVDVTEWGNFSRGPKYASMNPKYCYEWSFVDKSGIVVLNLWFEDIEERGSTVSIRTNMRHWSQRMAKQATKGVWVQRAARVDEAIRFAFESNAQVRVIVNDGEKRDVEDPKAQASVVRSRLLDPLPWAVRKYNPNTGDCMLVRDVSSSAAVDQFDLEPMGHTYPERADLHGNVFVRDPAVRATVLLRAAGKCEYCGTPGFVTKAREVFLETHHIVPLSEGGPDSIWNVAAVCPNHHREAHHGAGSNVIRDFLLDVAAQARPQRKV